MFHLILVISAYTTVLLRHGAYQVNFISARMDLFSTRLTNLNGHRLRPNNHVTVTTVFTNSAMTSITQAITRRINRPIARIRSTRVITLVISRGMFNN